MQIEPQVSCHGVPATAEVDALCRKEIGKLERYHGRITSCRVVIGKPHHRHHEGDLFSVRIRLGLPGGEVEVNREPPDRRAHEHLRVALRDAFDAARRRLQDYVRRQEGRTKHHEPSRSRERAGTGQAGSDAGLA